MQISFQEAFERIKKLVDNFENNYSYYKSPKYQEAEVRKDFIDPLLTALGWDVNHEYQKNPYKQEVKVEKTQKQEGATLNWKDCTVKPVYIFTFFNF